MDCTCQSFQEETKDFVFCNQNRVASREQRMCGVELRFATRLAHLVFIPVGVMEVVVAVDPL